MNPETEVERILREDKAVLVRNNGHKIWRLSNGSTFTQSCTPSDRKTGHNQLRDLRRCLGLDQDRGKPGERREKKVKHEKQPKSYTSVLGEQLYKTVVEPDLVKELEDRNDSLVEEIEWLDQRYSRLLQSKEECDKQWQAEYDRLYNQWQNRWRRRVEEWLTELRAIWYFITNSQLT